MKFFPNFQIIQNSDGIFISQDKYLKYLLKRFGLESCNPIRTPMIIGHKLSSKDETPIVEHNKYRSMIKDLQYLNHNKLDIENVVGIVARSQADPKESHYAVVKRIFRYLKGTPTFQLWYDRSSDFTLCAYIDAAWVGSMDGRKSTSGGAFFLGGRLVSWLRKKHDCISQSTINIEYVETTNNGSQIMWMKKMLKDIGIEFLELLSYIVITKAQ